MRICNECWKIIKGRCPTCGKVWGLKIKRVYETDTPISDPRHFMVEYEA